MQLGVSSFAFGWNVGFNEYRPLQPFTEWDLVDYARRQSLRVIQFGDNLPVALFDVPRLEALRVYADQHPSPIEIEIGGRGLTPENIERHIEVAQRLRSSFIRFVVDRKDYEPSPDEVVAILLEANSALASRGITLGIENHDRFSARTLRDIVERVGSPSVGICLDTVNSLGAGEGIDYVLNELGALTVNLHIKDFDILRVPYAMGFHVEGRPAGGGRLDLQKLLATIASYGRCHSAVLETWVPPQTVFADTLALERVWVDQSIDHLKSLWVNL